MDTSTQWDLPPGFQPVRYGINEQAKNAVRELLQPNEPVIISLANEEETVSIIATPQRLFAARTGQSAGVTGCMVKEFPWGDITNLVLQHAGPNVKIAVHYKTSDGRTVATGLRAKLAKPAVDNLMPFDPAIGAQAFEAIYSVWQHKSGGAGLGI